MTHTPVSTTVTERCDLKATHDAQRKAKIRWSIVAVAALSGILAVARHHTSTTPCPFHTSLLTGIGWVRELQSGHPDCF
ncbi:hypothetical protein BJV74DRAFT_775162 [Russula compacta]|nr:hypothetical protein BJV74DRAFT_775162 [Russula compacta]